MDELVLSGKQASTLIRSCDGLIRYKLGHLRSLYVLSNDTPEEFCERFNLNLDAINRAIRDGEWELLRSKYSGGDVSELLNSTKAQLQTLYENELAQFELLSFQEQQQIDHLRQHRARFGDLFMHDAVTGDIKLDVYGQPIPLPLPNNAAKLLSKAKTCELLEGLTRCLSAAKEMEGAKKVNPAPEVLEKTTRSNAEIDAEIFGKRGE